MTAGKPCSWSLRNSCSRLICPHIFIFSELTLDWLSVQKQDAWWLRIGPPGLHCNLYGNAPISRLCPSFACLISLFLCVSAVLLPLCLRPVFLPCVCIFHQSLYILWLLWLILWFLWLIVFVWPVFFQVSMVLLSCHLLHVWERDPSSVVLPEVSSIFSLYYKGLFCGTYCHTWFEGVRTEDVARSRDCKAPWGKFGFVILGYINNIWIDLTHVVAFPLPFSYHYNYIFAPVKNRFVHPLVLSTTTDLQGMWSLCLHLSFYLKRHAKSLVLDKISKIKNKSPADCTIKILYRSSASA